MSFTGFQIGFVFDSHFHSQDQNGVPGEECTGDTGSGQDGFEGPGDAGESDIYG